MTRFSDAALLKGDYAKMLKNPPDESDWRKAACDSGAEETAQTIAKQIFGFQQSLDEKSERLEVVTFSSLGPIKVLGITPLEGNMMRIDGHKPDSASPISIVQNISQLSLTFTKVASTPDEPEVEDGLQIGFVIFDELKERKKVRDAAKRRKPAARTRSKGKKKND